MLFDEIAKDALDYSKVNKCPDACRIDRWHHSLVMEWFGNKVAKDITPQDIEERLSALAEAKELRPATLNRYRAFLSLIYSRANRNGKVSVNPARLVTLSFDSWCRARRRPCGKCFKRSMPTWKRSLTWR